MSPKTSKRNDHYLVKKSESIRNVLQQQDKSGKNLRSILREDKMVFFPESLEHNPSVDESHSTQNYLSYYNLRNEQHHRLQDSRHRNRRRHHHKYNKYRNDSKNVGFVNQAASGGEHFGYVVDTNNQRFIRQAARVSIKNNAAQALTTSSEVAFNTPVVSTKVLVPSSTALNYTWPMKRSVDLEGDILIGGLHMVHERNTLNTCGQIMPQGGVQAVEAMLHAIDYVNNEMLTRGDWIKNVSLGVHILDDCDTDTYGLEMAVDFIKGNVFKLVLIISKIFKVTLHRQYYKIVIKPYIYEKFFEKMLTR
jgi:metabotropic X receptor